MIVKLLWQSSFQALHLVHLQHVAQVDREVDGQRAAGPGLGRGQVVVVVGGQAQDLLSLRVSTSLKGVNVTTRIVLCVKTILSVYLLAIFISTILWLS